MQALENLLEVEVINNNKYLLSSTVNIDGKLIKTVSEFAISHSLSIFSAIFQKCKFAVAPGGGLLLVFREKALHKV